jgi:RecB family endonuclease NucS
LSQIPDSQKSEIIQLLQENKLNREQIADKTGVSPGVVSAIKAHITMGTYTEPSEAEEVIDAMETTFGLERDLQTALRFNIHQLEQGLVIIDEGKEQTTKAGRIDITAQDQQGDLVIIELKAGSANPDCIAQILSYMGALAERNHKNIRGILVAGDFSPRVIFASRAVPNLQLKKYTFKFTFQAVD